MGLSIQGEPQTDINQITVLTNDIFYEENNICCSDKLKAVQSAVPELAAQLQAILFLSRTPQTVLAPTIANSTAVGSLMRKKLKPVFDPILMHLRLLQA